MLQVRCDVMIKQVGGLVRGWSGIWVEAHFVWFGMSEWPFESGSRRQDMLSGDVNTNRSRVAMQAYKISDSSQAQARVAVLAC